MDGTLQRLNIGLPALACTVLLAHVAFFRGYPAGAPVPPTVRRTNRASMGKGSLHEKHFFARTHTGK
jgi:hypothetical protein